MVPYQTAGSNVSDHLNLKFNLQHQLLGLTFSCTSITKYTRRFRLIVQVLLNISTYIWLLLHDRSIAMSTFRNSNLLPNLESVPPDFGFFTKTKSRIQNQLYLTLTFPTKTESIQVYH
jgi:hypothetical protein